MTVSEYAEVPRQGDVEQQRAMTERMLRLEQRKDAYEPIFVEMVVRRRFRAHVEAR
jgi:hypothetical protein